MKKQNRKEKIIQVINRPDGTLTVLTQSGTLYSIVVVKYTTDKEGFPVTVYDWREVSPPSYLTL